MSLSRLDESFRRKLGLFLGRCEARGEKLHRIAPRAVRWLWAMGVEVPPPCFIGFAPLVLVLGGPLGVLMAVGLWVVTPDSVSEAGAVAVASGVLGGLVFGLCMATYYRLQAHLLGVGRWSDYAEDEP